MMEVRTNRLLKDVEDIRQKFPPTSDINRIGFLKEEYREFMEEVDEFFLHGDQSPERSRKIVQEAYDLIWNVLELLSRTGENIETVFREKYENNMNRAFSNRKPREDT
jgi:phosphoribosyl-ATP pyrophosphohydrolase